MWEHPSTAAHLAALERWGVAVVPPASKMLACGQRGTGALAEVPLVPCYSILLLKNSSFPLLFYFTFKAFLALRSPRFLVLVIGRVLSFSVAISLRWPTLGQLFSLPLTLLYSPSHISLRWPRSSSRSTRTSRRRCLSSVTENPRFRAGFRVKAAESRHSAWVSA